MKVNSTRQKLRDGQPIMGVFATMPTPEPLEMCALLGFDFVMIDGEHGPITESIAGHMIRAAEAAGITPLVRVPRNEAPSILRMLDQGAQGIMVPQVNTRADAERAVAACRYFPEGRRGMAPMRAADFGLGRPYPELLAHLNREVMVIVQCENIASVNALDDILRVPGIDVVFIGPGDLSQSLGIPGQLDAPPVLDAIERIIRSCQQANVTAAMYVRNVQGARHYTARGVRMLGIGDTTLFASGASTFRAGALQA